MQTRLFTWNWAVWKPLVVTVLVVMVLAVTVLAVTGLATTGLAQALPSSSVVGEQEITLQPCPAPPAGQMVTLAHYDHAYEWRRGGRLRRVELRRRVVKDAYATLTLDYGLGGQLLKVEETFEGEAGRTGRVWLLESGQVVSAQGYDRPAGGQTTRRTLPPSGLPALYRAAPTKVWYQHLACPNPAL